MLENPEHAFKKTVKKARKLKINTPRAVMGSGYPTINTGDPDRTQWGGEIYRDPVSPYQSGRPSSVVAMQLSSIERWWPPVHFICTTFFQILNCRSVMLGLISISRAFMYHSTYFIFLLYTTSLCNIEPVFSSISQGFIYIYSNIWFVFIYELSISYILL